MPEPAHISAKTGKGLRAVALMVVLCLLCAVGWSVAASAGQGGGVNSAAVDPPAKAPPGAGSDSRDGNPPPGKFYLPRQLFIEVSRTAPRDPPVPQPAPLVPLPPDLHGGVGAVGARRDVANPGSGRRCRQGYPAHADGAPGSA